MKYIPVFLFTMFSILMYAGNGTPTKGVIIKCSEKKVQSIKIALNSSRAADIQYENLGIGTDLFLVTGNLGDKILFEYCKKEGGVEAVEYNYQLETRIKPNDTRLGDQYYLDLIKAFQSWDLITGGKNFAGKDIVIGVIDEGFEIAHEDLKDNIYANPDETSGDGIDNDGNGLKDDINGWNIKNNNNTHEIRSHGTNVIGVIGARGNNQLGISGVNWNIKILPVTIGNFVSEVIKGYQYLLAEKTAYNNSEGTKGANIVVSNYSGGLPKAFASDHPIWCGLYDLLGLQGMLNVSATTNDNDNVEVVGDMPSTCTSNYLLVVNSTNKADEKDASTGFGNVSIDISAPGESILTTDIGSRGKYRFDSGTSLSTPMVASAAALLFSIKCASFHALVTSDPKNAVLKVKEAIMSGVDKKTSLTSRTVSEGRLNLKNSLDKLIKDNCTNELAPVGELKINQIRFNAGAITIDYLSPDTKELTLNLYSSDGKLVYTTKFTPPLFGTKQYTFNPEIQFPGLFYYCSLISDKKVVSKGFTVQDVSR
jgi:subtilisin family serine protease